MQFGIGPPTLKRWAILKSPSGTGNPVALHPARLHSIRRNGYDRKDEVQLIVEVKAAKAIADEHLAQILGYLRSAKMEHGVLVNFGTAKFQIRKLAMSKAREG